MDGRTRCDDIDSNVAFFNDDVTQRYLNQSEGGTPDAGRRTFFVFGLNKKLYMYTCSVLMTSHTQISQDEGEGVNNMRSAAGPHPLHLCYIRNVVLARYLWRIFVF